MLRSRSVFPLASPLAAHTESLETTLLDGSLESATPASASTHRRGDRGMFANLKTLSKRTLKATSLTIAYPFYATTKTRPTRAKPKPEAAAGDASILPGNDPKPPRSLGHKHERNIDAVVPQDKSVSTRAEIRFGLPVDIDTPEGARRYIDTQWKEVICNGRFQAGDIDRLTETLSQYLLERDTAAHERGGEALARAGTRAIMVSDALARATNGDPVRARAALTALLEHDTPASPRVQADVLALQIALGTSGVGMETLLTVAPHTLPLQAHGDASSAEIQREAFRQALRAAEVLLANKPASEIGPTSLDALSTIAEAVLPSAERERPRASPGNRIEPIDMASDPVPAWLVDPNHTLAVKALKAANLLRAAPAADCPRHLAEAYFAWRNGFDREGAGTDLSKSQHRLFKLLTYADRAAETNFVSRALSGFFGMRKSPLSALQNLGTNGLMLHQPHREFAVFTDALDAVKARLVDCLNDSTVSRPDKVQYAVKIAALDQWQQRMASKGLRSSYRFSSSDLEAIAIRARALTPNRIPLSKKERAAYFGVDHGGKAEALPSTSLPSGKTSSSLPREELADRSRNIEAIGAALRQLDKMTPARLRDWAEHAWRPADEADCAGSDGGSGTSLLPDTVAEKIRAFEGRFVDVRPHPGDSAAQLDAIDAIAKEMPDTYDIRLSSGGAYGVASVTSESLAALSSAAAVPMVAALPDIGAIKGRHAVIDIGSNQHFGHVFIGTDSRNSIYGGMGGFAGWSFGKKGLAMLGVSGGARRSRNTGGPCGVTIRTRRSDDEAPGHPDAWRTKMLGALAALRTSGPNSGRPRTAEEMWSGLAQRYWKDPALSVNWTDNRDETVATSGSASVTARAGTAKTKWGPSISAGTTLVHAAQSRLADKTGNHRVDVAALASGRVTPVAFTVVEGLPGAQLHQGAQAHQSGHSHAPHLAAFSFPSAPYIGFGTKLFATNTNAALRIGHDSDRIVPKHTFRDTEFGTFKEFKQYVDCYRAEWLAALGGGKDAAKKLDDILVAVKKGSAAGNVVMGERWDMTGEAAKRLDFLFHLRQRYERSPKLSAAETRELARINADIRHTLASESSWRRQSLYAYEVLGAQRTLGLSFLLNAQSMQSVSGVRELAVLGT
jgi:hypothetical protein